MSKRRYTIQTLKAGQAGPYQPHIYRYRIFFEWQGTAGFKDPDAEFIPAPIDSKEMVRQYARVHGNWQEPADENWPPDAMGQHFATKLVYLMQVEPHVWEWETRQEYCD